MASILSHFDADEYVDFVKKESYDSGALNSTISLFLKGHLTKNIALEETHLSESDFDAAVAAFKLRK
ncbi:MAG: hypothetical protein MJZ11_10005 [Lachnospiraceae bacterium]|nr:hypothetical protein [Lachnospiraceae bacterium]